LADLFAPHEVASGSEIPAKFSIPSSHHLMKTTKNCFSSLSVWTIAAISRKNDTSSIGPTFGGIKTWAKEVSRD